MAITEVRSNDTGAEKPVNFSTKKQETTDTVYKNSKEYLEFLRGEYSCLQGKRDSSVIIAPDLLSKAAADSKTGQWLEENLKLIPDVMNKIHQNAAQNGARVVSCQISFDGYDSMTTQVHTVSEVETGTDKIKKTLEEIRAKTKEQKKQQQEILEKRENSQRVLTNNTEGLLQRVAHHDFTNKNNVDDVSIDFKI